MLLGCIQGVTELLPISSSAHLFLANRFFQLPVESDRLFEVVVHLGSACALLLFYFRRLCAASFSLHSSFISKLCMASFPAAILGFFLHNVSKAYLHDTSIMGLSLMIGGVVFLVLDTYSPKISCSTPEQISFSTAVMTGCCQAIALVPGVSRSGATIACGVACGMSKRAAVEFSFFLALPVLFGAGIYELYKCRDLVTMERSVFLGIGGLFSCISSYCVISPAISFLEKHGLWWFGWYRIVVGILVLFF
jgi:undecaprenyl-diphosphatase